MRKQKGDPFILSMMKLILSKKETGFQFIKFSLRQWEKKLKYKNQEDIERASSALHKAGLT